MDTAHGEVGDQGRHRQTVVHRSWWEAAVQHGGCGGEGGRGGGAASGRLCIFNLFCICYQMVKCFVPCSFLSYHLNSVSLIIAIVSVDDFFFFFTKSPRHVE